MTVFRNLLAILFFPMILSAAQSLPKQEVPPLIDPKEVIDLQLKSIDHLTSLTQDTLCSLQDLRKGITTYQTIQNHYLNNTKDKELLYQMTRMANSLLKEIKRTNLTHVFDVEFISELNMLSNLQHKHELPRL